MNKTGKNIDELFEHVRTSKVNLSTDQIASALAAGATIGASAATSAATTGFLGISNSTRMIGTLVTVATAATIVGIQLSDEEYTETIPDTSVRNEILAADITSNPDLDKAFEAVEQAMSGTPLSENPVVESSHVNSDIQLTNGQTIHIEQTTAVLTEVSDSVETENRVVIRWDDSDEDFRSKIDMLRARGLHVLANRFNFNDKYHLKLNIIDTSGRGSDLININLSGEYEVELGWEDHSGTSEFYYKTASKGSINTVKNGSSQSAQNNSGVIMNSASTNTDGTTQVRTVTGSSSTITTTSVTTDSQGNIIRDKKKEISRENNIEK